MSAQASPVATSLVVASQPSSTVEDANFTVTIQIKDQFGSNFAGTNSISVAKQSGTGTLSGTSPVSAIAGLATFSNLQMDTSGATVVLRFSATGLGTVDTTSITITAAAAGTWLANKPSGWNTSAGTAFDPSWAVPSGTGERTIASGPWTAIFDEDSGVSRFTRMTGLSGLPSGATAAWDLIFAAGTYSDGTTFGNVGTPITSTGSLYVCKEIWYSSGFVFHSISHKGDRQELSGGNMLEQTKHDANYWRCSDEAAGQDYDAFQVNNTAPTLNAWNIWEYQLIRNASAGTLNVWLNGILQWSCTSLPVAASANFTSLSIDGHMGGGGFTLGADQHSRLGACVMFKP